MLCITNKQDLRPLKAFIKPFEASQRSMKIKSLTYFRPIFPLYNP